MSDSKTLGEFISELQTIRTSYGADVQVKFETPLLLPTAKVLLSSKNEQAEVPTVYVMSTVDAEEIERYE